MSTERGPDIEAVDDELAAARFDEACEAYLERRLSSAATRAFERALAEPALSLRFREALLLRELLGTVGPDAPADLADELAKLVRAELAPGGLRAAHASAAGSALLSSWRAAVAGIGWTLRGPSLAFSAAPAAPSGTGPVLRGMGTLRYAVPALLPDPEKPRPRRPPLWWRLLRGRRA